MTLGAVLGWLAGLLNGSEGGRATCAAIIAGVLSALLSGIALPPMFGKSPLIIDGGYPAASVAIAFTGTFVFSVIAMMFLRRQR